MFFEKEKTHGRSSLLLFPDLEIAPSHGLVKLDEEGLVIDYISGSDQLTLSNKKGHLVDVGIRYFSAKLCLSIRAAGFNNERYIPGFLAEFVPVSHNFLGCLFFEPWRHFATIRDFKVSESLL